MAARNVPASRPALTTRQVKPVPKKTKRKYGIDITQVTFRANVSMPGERFNHIHVEASASVGTDDPQDVLDGLKRFIGDELMRARGGVPVVAPTDGRFRIAFDDSSDSPFG